MALQELQNTLMQSILENLARANKERNLEEMKIMFTVTQNFLKFNYNKKFKDSANQIFHAFI